MLPFPFYFSIKKRAVIVDDPKIKLTAEEAEALKKHGEQVVKEINDAKADKKQADRS